MGNSNKYEKYKKLLEANKNLILTGAPGTGKTFLAKDIAKEIEAEYDFVQFHPSYDYTDFVEGLRPTPPDNNGNIGFERKDGIFKAFCKEALNNSIQHLHLGDSPKEQELTEENIRKYIIPDTEIFSSQGRSKYTIKRIYETKVELSGDSIRDYSIPINKIIDAYKNRLWKGGQKHGFDPYTAALAKHVYEKIKEKDTEDQNIGKEENRLSINNNKNYVFIIDEINRGEISKIFGELFFSIDPGYRGEKGLVKTQYQNLITDESDPFYEGFYVPENVYIIGTMNDIDRSVENMDFAMRRRFAWEEVKANENTGMLDGLKDMKEEVIEVMQRLNAAIWNEDTNTGIEGLNAAYHIGGSYFSKLELYLDEDHTNKEAAYKHLWDNHLKGVLLSI